MLYTQNIALCPEIKNKTQKEVHCKKGTWSF